MVKTKKTKTKPKAKPAAKKKETGPKRWKVPLRGGVFQPGSDSFELRATAFIHVHAETAEEARELASEIAYRMNGEGRLIPEEGLDLEALVPLQVKAGDVERLEDYEDPRDAAHLHGLGAPEGGTHNDVMDADEEHEGPKLDGAPDPTPAAPETLASTTASDATL